MTHPERPRRYAVALFLTAMLAGCRGRTAAASSWPSLTLEPQDRLLILAPHPDDEVLGCGGILERAVAMRLPVRVIFFTYGDNNQWSFAIYRKHPVVMPKAIQAMGLVRHDEALAAARILGVHPRALIFLGYPDFGTLHLWTKHWGDRPPFQSMLTRVTAVPYQNARRPGAPYKGEAVLRDLTEEIRGFRPTKIFVSHPADHMPDHRALYLFTRVALWDLASDLQPALYPYLVHFQRWPRPRGDRPLDRLEPPTVLREPVAWQTCDLAPEMVDLKRRAIRAHRTQFSYSASYLLSFMRANELFGDFPDVALSERASPIELAAAAARGEPPEQLTEVERAAFVGLETRSVQLEGQTLVLAIEFSRPLAQLVEASIYVFGYRADRPFAEMPKLRVKLGAIQTVIVDQDRALPGGMVDVNRQPKAVVIRIPLHLLGDPQKILTSAQTYLGEVPLDWASWRVLTLPGDR